MDICGEFSFALRPSSFVIRRNLQTFKLATCEPVLRNIHCLLRYHNCLRARFWYCDVGAKQMGNEARRRTCNSPPA
jgi:hypothetical protein